MTNKEKAELLALMKEEETKDEKSAMMPEISSITIHNVIQADIKNKSMMIPISILDRQEGSIETKALLDTGAGGKFIDQNFVLLNQLQTQKLKKPITVYNVDGTKNKKGTIT